MTVQPLTQPATQPTLTMPGNAAALAAKKNPDAKLLGAAKKFESVLLTQLLQVLWKSAPEMSKGQGGMYQSMFEGSFADHLAEGGGIGLADMIAQGLGAKPKNGAPLTRHVSENVVNSGGLGVARPADVATGQPGSVMADVSAAASGMLARGGSRWAKQGRLAPEDFGTAGSPVTVGDAARRTVQNAQGYQGYYKCNLFAFELARRAGLDVPVTPQGAGVTFPSSNRVAQDASDGSLHTGWAKVATGASPAAMQAALHAGEAAFLLVGQGVGDAHGHMAVIEQPRSIDYDTAGHVRSITFDGWEAQPDGAKHLTQRTWNQVGQKPTPGARNGLERIEIIQLNRTAADRRAVPEVGPTRPTNIGLK
jgi:Rod binding domain-containing protein